MFKKVTLLSVLLVASPFTAQAEDTRTMTSDSTMRARMGETKDQAKFHKLVDESADVYSAIVKGPHGEVPAKVLASAECIAVFPNVMTGALVVGGTHGEGLVSCQNGAAAWSQPVNISINQGSIGLQAGAKSADVVLFFQNKDAVQALKRGSFSLGTDVSAVAGEFSANANFSNVGVVVYTRTAGLFAGASVNGSKITKNTEELERYYGKKADYSSVLEGKEMPDSTGYTAKLTKMFPIL